MDAAAGERSLVMISVCRGCGKLIDWIRTNGGKKMPVDMDPVPFVADRNGTEFFVRRDGSVTAGRRAEGKDTRAETGYTSHFATCPKADDFRKKEARQKKTTENYQQMSMIL